MYRVLNWLKMKVEKMNKPVVCFEGPSGVGKTTLSNLLQNDFNIVPEVNLLFDRTSAESEYWYHERQVDRYELCRKSEEISILDGDVFQPIWYNWVCQYPSNFLSKEQTHRFYRTMLEEGNIAFPDLYIIFHINEKELWKRKERDKSRQRRNFEKHLKIIEPLKDYWRFLERDTEIDLKFVRYEDVDSAYEDVLALIQSLEVENLNNSKTFDQIDKWINVHS